MTEPQEPSVLVTGATGRLGGRVARRLAEQGVAQRLLTRNPERAPELPGATPVRGEYGDCEALPRCLAGARTVFMVSAPESAQRLAQHREFVDAAAKAGVAHLVYVSFFGAAPDATFTLARDHFHTEEHIRASGMAYRSRQVRGFLKAQNRELAGHLGSGRRLCSRFEQQVLVRPTLGRVW
ncbi:NAD(P)H-binding protein [Streptomyces sp. NPDC051576]|uniref:NAD(P)H-binding protein n=1 Tax=Streptomyces sp. NPDC051576 TaxID=3155803 RepID=UPI003434C767